MNARVHVVKLGGSLLDLPDLVARWRAYRAAELGERVLLVVGGGAAADAVRRFDARCDVGPSAAHWLAVRAMRFQAHLLLAGLERAALVAQSTDCEAVWQRGELAVMEPWAWLQHDEACGSGPPHTWDYTSDSIAAAAAQQLGAARLTLLKSALPCAADGGALRTCTAAQASEQGVVDACFAQVAHGLARVELVNLRDAQRARVRVVGKG